MCDLILHINENSKCKKVLTLSFWTVKSGFKCFFTRQVISFCSHNKNQIVNNIKSFDIIIRLYIRKIIMFTVYYYPLLVNFYLRIITILQFTTRKKKHNKNNHGTSRYTIIYIYYILSYVYTLQQIIISNERTTEVQLFPN